MDSQFAEKLYQAAEDSLRTSLQAWASAFEAARSAGRDRGKWQVEEAAWTANRRAMAVRNLAWEAADQALSVSRDQARADALEAAGSSSDSASVPTPTSPLGTE